MLDINFRGASWREKLEIAKESAEEEGRPWILVLLHFIRLDLICRLQGHCWGTWSYRTEKDVHEYVFCRRCGYDPEL